MARIARESRAEDSEQRKLQLDEIEKAVKSRQWFTKVTTILGLLKLLN